MGLDALVPCRCWVDGLTPEPPIDRSLLEYSEGDLFVRSSDNSDLDELIEMDKVLNAWLETCCPHPDLAYCTERVDNWAAVRTFTYLANQLDDGRLGMLCNLMPAVNGGEVTPADAQRCLDELDVMRTLAQGQTVCFLSDATTGEEIFEYSPAYDGLLRMHRRIQSGFDPGGIFAETSDSDESSFNEAFRAMRVIQRVVGESDGHPIVRWIGDNNAEFESVGLGIGEGNREWQVTSRPLAWADVPCVDKLTNLLRASVKIDMPVFWW